MVYVQSVRLFSLALLYYNYCRMSIVHVIQSYQEKLSFIFAKFFQFFIDKILIKNYNIITVKDTEYKIKECANVKSLIERAQELNKRPSIMEGRNKGENDKIVGKIFTIGDYDFLKDDKGSEYVVYTLKELDDLFFFGGITLTQHLRTLDLEGYKDTIKSDGLPIRLSQSKSKKGRTYYTVEFAPRA